MMKKGFVSFELLKHNTSCGRVQLSVTGDHNVSNALAAIATAELLGIPMDTIRKDFYPSAEQTADLNTRELLTV